MKKTRNVTPQMVVEMLKREGQEITIEQAEKVLDFMYKIAEIELSNLSNKNVNKQHNHSQQNNIG